MIPRALILFLFAVLAVFSFLGLASSTVNANPASFSLVGRAANPAGWGLTSTVMTPGPDLTVAAGEVVMLSLRSGDSVGHNWGVDYDNDMVHDPGEPLSNTTSTSTSFTFTATATPGTYHYYCFIHPGLMLGRFIVLGPDFTISANPTTIGPLNNGTLGSSTINVGSISGFTGTVDLTVALSNGLIANVNPMSIPGAAGTSTLTVSAANAGSYSVTVTGTSGPLSHSVVVMVSVVAPDFSLSSVSTLSVAQGSSQSFTVNLASLAGFSGNVDLTATVTPAGPVVSPSSATVALAPDGAGSFVVNVSAVSGNPSMVPVGVYTVRVTGVSGPVSHSADVAVTVRLQGVSAIGNLPWTYVIGVSGAAIGAAAVALLLVHRGRSKKE